MWAVGAFDQSLQSMLDNLTPELIDQLQIVNQDVTSSLDEAVQILEDIHATEDQDQNDSDNESNASKSGYDGDISESDNNMSDVSESDSDTSASSYISNSDSNMSYTSESDSNMSNISEPNIESNISDSDNDSDTAQRSNPWDVEYLQQIQSAIDNLSVEAIHQIRSSHIEHYVSEAAWNEATRIFDNFHAEYLRIVQPDTDHNLEDSDDEERNRDLLIYLIREQIPLEIQTVHKYSTKTDRANRDN